MKFTIEIKVPEGLSAGDVFQVEVETPKTERKSRGAVVGIPLNEMTDEQLKRELTNANSVLYKSKQRNAPEDVIAKHQERVDAAKAEKASRMPVKVVAEAVSAVVEGVDDTVYDETAAEEL